MNYLSPKSIAKKLDMSPKSVHRMLERGELPFVTFSTGRKRVSEEALERFMKKAERNSRKNTSSHVRNGLENGDSESRLSAVQSDEAQHKSL